jgi:uncharacterized protein (UPF0261 family)
MTEKSIVIDVAEIVSSSASNDDPKESAAMFAALVKRLYRERKDVTAMIAAGEAGVKFCLEAAEGATDEILAKDLKTSAKTIASTRQPIAGRAGVTRASLSNRAI